MTRGAHPGSVCRPLPDGPAVRSPPLSRHPRTLVRRPVVWLRHRGIQPADAIVGNYPRSGSTWLTIMLAEALTGSEVDQGTVDELVPMVGAHRGAPRLLPRGGRLLRTHERYRREYRRAVYVVRDPRDVVVSYYHFRRGFLADFAGTISEFVDAFCRGAVDGYGSWNRHVLSWLDGDADVLVVRYEDLVARTETAVEKSVAFLDTPADPERVRRAVANNTVARMREKENRVRPALADADGLDRRSVRLGIPGAWRGQLGEQERLRLEAAARPAMERLGYVDEAS